MLMSPGPAPPSEEGWSCVSLDARAEEASTIGMSSTTFTVNASTSSDDASIGAAVVSTTSPREAVVRLTSTIADGASVAVTISGCGASDGSVSLVDGLGIVSSLEVVVSTCCSVVSAIGAAASGIEGCGVGFASTVSIVVFA